MKIYFVANARMPTEKAHGIHIAKMCEALIELGHEVALVTPARGTGSLKEFYGLRVEVPRVVLPTLRFVRFGRVGFALMSASFMLMYMAFFAWRRLRGEHYVLYTVDIDTFSHTLLPLCGSVIAEMHSPKRPTALSRFFFNRAHIVATNPINADEIKRTFGVSDVLVEPNGVDATWFVLPSRSEARQKLGLVDVPMALYVGRLYKWKGLEILSAASELIEKSGIRTQVLGGERAEFERVFGAAGDLQFAEAKPHEVPLWLAAADVLLLVGTRHNPDSERYTTPMKVFEYLASGRSVVASATEALKSTVPANAALFVEPDDAKALASAIERVIAHPAEFAHNIETGLALARTHTWEARARRIMQHFDYE